MSLLKRVSAVWTAFNNLGVGNNKDPLQKHYNRQGKMGVVIVSSVAPDPEKRHKRDLEVSYAPHPVQLQCNNGEEQLACLPDYIVNDPERFVCPQDDGKGGFVPVLCSKIIMLNNEALIGYSPAPVFGASQEDDCGYRPSQFQTDSDYWVKNVCNKIPNGVSSVCFQNITCVRDVPTQELDNWGAGVVGVVVGFGTAVAVWTVKTVGQTLYGWYCKPEPEPEPTQTFYRCHSLDVVSQT